MRKFSFIIQYLLIAISITIFLIIAIPKIFFPYEAHWMEGAMLSEISWILSGHLLYSPPSIYHVPSLYQPLYFYLSAGITAITQLTYPTARIISILATTATTAMIYYVIRKETGKFSFAISGVGLYIAAFGKTEYGFVSARIDPLLTALLIAGFITIYYSDTYKGIFLGSVIFTLSFFTKQSALIFLPAVSIYLLVVRGWKRSFYFSFISIVSIFIGIIALHIYFDGWYTFYAFSIIRAMSASARWGFAINGLFFYIFLRCWFLSIILLFFPIRSLFKRSKLKPERATTYFGFFLGFAIIEGFLGILNPGGGHNVLLPTAVGCALFLPLLAFEFESKPIYSKYAIWLIPIQIAFLISNPLNDSRNFVTNVDKENYEKFYSSISLLDGEVWIPYHSYTQPFTKKNEYSGFDFSAGALLPDDPRAKNYHSQLDSAFTNKHWSYIFSDFKQAFPYYQLQRTLTNPNKARGSDDTLLYVYRPE